MRNPAGVENQFHPRFSKMPDLTRIGFGSSVVTINFATMNRPSLRSRNRHFLSIRLSVVALFLLAAFASPVGAAELDRAFAMTDLDGEERRPFQFNEGDRAALFVFVWHTCPVANAYAPEIERIFREHEAKGISTYLVEVDPKLTPEKAREHVADYRLTMPVFVDREHRLAGALGATHSPQAVVVTPDGNIVYRGRIDDRQADYGKRRATASVTDLRDVLTEVAAGDAPDYRETLVVGCYLPEVD